MAQQTFKYIVVGAGLAGCGAIEGIRTSDSRGSLLLLGDEKHLPYDRPPLTKQLWFGKKGVGDIFVHDMKWFQDFQVDVKLGMRAIRLNPANKTVTTENNDEYQYEKLLLATGGTPRVLDIEGGSIEDIYYYRRLDDYMKLKAQIWQDAEVLVIGGGFIGSEISAALNVSKADVTMLVKEKHISERIFPKDLAIAIMRKYLDRGIKIITEERPASILKDVSGFRVRTNSGREIKADIVVVGIGIVPEVALAESAGLQIENGIVVDEYLQTSAPDVYAAGDNASFPYQALGIRTRVEHWDNAKIQGTTAGMNMAGGQSPYMHMPYFFSDLFDFGYEAVGKIDSRLDTFTDWQKENDRGVVYYLERGKVCGAMMCNVWNKVDEARELIRNGESLVENHLLHAIH